MRLVVRFAALLLLIALTPFSSQQAFALSDIETGDNASAMIAQIGPRAGYVVTSLNDTGSGTLRQAILDANVTPEADTITFEPGLIGVIALGSALPDITRDLTIIGPGSDVITIDPTGTSNAFRAPSGPASPFNLNISGLTLSTVFVGVSSNGNSVSLTDMVINGSGSRSILAQNSSMTLTRVTVTGNVGALAVYSASSTLSIVDSTISGSAQTAMQVDGGTVTITGSTFASNTGASAGAIYANGATVATTVNISSSTFSNNTGPSAGAIFAWSNPAAVIVNVTNSTFSGNSASVGTGADAINTSGNATVDISFSTFSGHSSSTATNDFGIIHAGTNADIVLWASIIANNPAGGTPRECTAGTGATFAASDNLTNDTFCTGRIGMATNVSATLADNGGLTQTHALTTGSSAIDAYTGVSCPATDQRGLPRPAADTDCDLGAYEFGAVAVPVCPTSPATISASDVAALILAIECANASTSDDVINLTNSTYLLVAIHNTDIAFGANGLPVIANAATAGTLTINGNGATISGNNQRRVLYVGTGATVEINDLTITEGFANVGIGGGGILNFSGTLTLNNVVVTQNSADDNDGGGIANDGTLNLIESTVSDNTVTGDSNVGGGIYNYSGAVTLTASTISGNSAGLGGGIWTDSGSTLTLIDSSVSNNTATGEGAGGIAMHFAASGDLIDSTVSGNGALVGGGIYNSSTALTITNSTITGNTATDSGGGISSSGTLTINNSTIAANTATSLGDGLYITDGTLILNNSILANAGYDCFADVTVSTPQIYHSLFSNINTCGPIDGVDGNIVGVDPMLGTLTGSPAYYPLNFASPAIDAGNDALIPSGVITDQAGNNRIRRARVDMGAFESNFEACPAFPAAIPDGDVAALILAIECANASPSNDVIELKDSSTYLLTATHNSLNGANGLPVIANAATAGTLTINGNGATISGNDQRRVLYVASGANLTLNELTIMDGRTFNNASGIYNFGTVTLNRSTVRDNFSAGDGGGIINLNTMTIVNSTITGNTTDGWGGGIANGSGGTLTLKNSTIAHNTATDGGGLSAGGGVIVHNTIVAANTATASPNLDCRGIVTASHSLFRIGSCGILHGAGSNIVGNTQTATLGLTLMMIADGGPAFYTINPSGVAVNAGSNALVPAGVTTDQPGSPRIQDITVDMGSYEVTAPPCPVSGDTIPAGDVDTLIYAIECANASPVDEVFELTNSTYTLTGAYNFSLNGLPQIADAAASGTLTLNGNGATISGSDAVRIFEVGIGGDLTLSGMTLIDGNVAGFNSGGAISVPSATSILSLTNVSINSSSAEDGFGGAIYNRGETTISDSTLSGNSANDGGAIYNSRTVTITGSTIIGNTASISGGGFYAMTGSLTLTSSTVADNVATGSGGGFYVLSGSVTLRESTVSGNTTQGNGAGFHVRNIADINLYNSTMFENTATLNGGAMFIYGVNTILSLVNSTVSLNTAADGAGIYMNNGSLTARNSILAGNLSGTGVNPDCYRVAGNNSSTHNLYQNGACGAVDGVDGNLVGVDPMLGALVTPVDGSPAYYPLLAGSPAINTGSNAMVTVAMTTDQAGNTRIQGGVVDMGSFETDTPSAPEINVTGNGEDIADGDTTPQPFDHTDFGTVSAGTPVTRTFTVHNTGTGALNLGSVTVPSGFSLAAPLTDSVVAVGGSTALNVRCDAVAVGVYFGTVTIPNDDADENPYTFDVTCWVNGPEIEIQGAAQPISNGDTTPSTADDTDFGTTTTGAPVGRWFTVMNTGTETLTLGTVNVPAGFSVVTQPSTTVLAGQSTSIAIQCEAATGGTFSGTVSLSNNDADENPFTFAITCTVLAPDMNITGNGVTIANGDSTPDLADHTDFGVTLVGTPVMRTFTIENNGSGPLNLTGFVGSPTGFIGDGNPPASTIPTGGSTTFSLICQASAEGTYSGTFGFTSNDPDESPYTFAVTCTVEAPPPPLPEINVTGNGVSIANGDTTPDLADHTDFGTTTVGTPVLRTFTIENSGAGTLEITDLNGPTGFTPVAPIPSDTVAASDSTTLNVQCDAASAGTYSGTITISSNDADESPYTFNITCQVNPGLPPDINITGNGLTIANGDTTPDLADHTDFGTTTVGTPVTRTFTIQNTGDGVLSLTGIGGTLTGFTGAGGPPAINIPGGGSTTFSLSCEAAAVGTYGGTLSISSTDLDESQYTFALTCQVDAAPPAGITLSESGGSTDVTEGLSPDSYIVSLNSQPTADVVVTLTFGGQITVNGSASPVTLTFTTANWNIPQTVTVAAVNDSLVEGPHSSLIMQAASSADAAYHMYYIADITIAITDNDIASIAFVSASGSVSEAAGSYMDNVVLTITSDPAGGTLASTVIANLDYVPGTATVLSDYVRNIASVGFGAGTGSGATRPLHAIIIDDALDELDETFTVTFGTVTEPAAASGTHTVTILDDDVSAATVTETNGATRVDEAGLTDSYTVVLNSQPSADVMITLTFDEQITVNGNVTPVALTFTPANWNVPQTVTVAAVNDSSVEGAHSALITQTASSADAAYNAIDPADVTVAIGDNDTATVQFAAPANANSEAVPLYQDNAVLLIQSDPVGGTLAVPVTVELLQTPWTASTPADYTLTTANLTFPAGTVNAATQAFSAAIVNDALDEPDETFTLSFGVATGPALASGTHTATILDDDSAGITIAESSTTSVAEGGATDTYTVALTSVPSAEVNVTLTFDGQITANGSASPVVLTFSDMTPQIVTVAAVNDSLAEGPHSALIAQTVSSSDATYSAIDPADVIVSIADNDSASVTFETATGSATEGLSPYTVNAVLSVVSDPAGGTLASTVEAQIVHTPGTAAMPADYTLTTASVIFLSGATHGAVQPVSVAIVDDALPEGDETFELRFGVSNIPASSVQTVTILASDLGNLLQNPGFETAGSGITKAVKWTSSALTKKDKRVCNTATKTFANTGDCAFRFHSSGVLTVSRVVKQTVKNPSLGVKGERYTLDAMISAANLTPGAKLILQVKYKNGTKAKAVINVPSGTYAYTAVETALPITRNVTWVRAKLVGGTASGRLLIDDLVLWVEPETTATITRSNDALLPPPPAPDGFRRSSTMP